jgi:hypothetical protein
MKLKHSFVTAARKTTQLAFLLSSLTVLTTLNLARAQSPSEVLEQGIYSEETKGDLDGAMQLYRKVIAQTRSDQSIAAQAQFHLGACYYKQRDFTNATAAFEQLVKFYPDQTNLIARAGKYFAGITMPPRPAPWTDGEVLRMNVKIAGGQKIGCAELSANAGETNGQKTWRLGFYCNASFEQFMIQVEVEAGTLKPLRSVYKRTLAFDFDGAEQVSAAYFPGHVELKTLGKQEGKKLQFGGSVIDFGELIPWERCLPHADGYKVTQPVLCVWDPQSGLDAQQVAASKFQVSGPETLRVPAGTYACYKVANLESGATCWFSADPKHYLVKVEVSGYVAELVSATQRAAGQGAAYADSSFGFSLAAPAGWFFDKSQDSADFTQVIMSDPQAVAACVLDVETRASLDTNAASSLRDFANSKFAIISKLNGKELRVRKDSWKELSLSGRPALGAVCDVVNGNGKGVLYAVSTFGATNSACFVSLLPAADFDAFRPRFDAVIQSFTMQ